MSEVVGLRLLIGELGQLPGNVRIQLRKGLKAAGQDVLDDARSNASWSSRIPRAMSLQARTSGAKTGVFIRVNSGRAPHARPFEGITDRRPFFRHPVFGDRDVWVSQPTRPFLAPAAQKGRPRVREAAEQAVHDAAAAAGFH